MVVIPLVALMAIEVLFKLYKHHAFYVVYLGLSFSKAYSSLKSITSSVAYRCLVITVLLLVEH